MTYYLAWQETDGPLTRPLARAGGCVPQAASAMAERARADCWLLGRRVQRGCHSDSQAERLDDDCGGSYQPPRVELHRNGRAHEPRGVATAGRRGTLRPRPLPLSHSAGLRSGRTFECNEAMTLLITAWQSSS